MNRHRTLALAAVALFAIGGAACGSDDDATAGNGDVRTVEIDMADNVFEPDSVDVNRGETVRFVFTNTGEVAHDAFVGDTAAQDGHEMDMREAEGDEHGSGHGDSGAVTVEPGDTAELTHTFDESGSLEIGCHQPGHYDGGMKLAIDVT
ncbi:MAG: cupredoxin domain-containing protein [Acidimicrobiia bacterium]|nr:cupredoxin domain-containing protein [Acidimicrobiia bacterium]